MNLNIKNREVYQLASNLAQLTGQSMTAVVLNALRKQWEYTAGQQQKETQVNDLMAIAQRCAEHIQQPATALEHGDMLYDETGMPQ